MFVDMKEQYKQLLTEIDAIEVWSYDIHNLKLWISVWISLSFNLNWIWIFPQSQQVVQSDHQHISEHVDWSINDAQLASIYVSPFNSHLVSWHIEFVAQKEELNIKCESLYMKSFEQEFWWLVCEKFKATLSVFCFDSEQKGYHHFEDKCNELSVPFSLYLFISICNFSRTYHHDKLCILLFLELFKFIPDML